MGDLDEDDRRTSATAHYFSEIGHSDTLAIGYFLDILAYYIEISENSLDGVSLSMINTLDDATFRAF